MIQAQLSQALSRPDITMEYIEQLEQQAQVVDEILNRHRLCHAAILSGLPGRFYRYASGLNLAKCGMTLPFAIMSGSPEMINVVAQFLPRVGLSYADIIEYAILSRKDDPVIIVTARQACGLDDTITAAQRLNLVNLAQFHSRTNILAWLQNV